MTPRAAALYIAVLLIAGAGWGMTQPLSKIAVSTGYQPFGLIFWQQVIGVLVMGVVLLIRRRRVPVSRRTLWTYGVIAMIGTVIPNSASYQALAHIPAGVQSVLMSLVPMAAFPIALALGLERFSLRRLVGLMVGLSGVLVLVLPKSSLPDPTMLPWVFVTLIAVLCYGFEGGYVAKWGLGGADPIQVLFGASLVGALIVLPLTLGSGQFIDPRLVWGAPEWALVASSLIHVLVYAIYVWLVGRAGPVFTAQVGYPVTGFGVIWAMLLLGESYSPFFWIATALILGGVVLVQPRRNAPLEAAGGLSETER